MLYKFAPHLQRKDMTHIVIQNILVVVLSILVVSHIIKRIVRRMVMCRKVLK